MGHIAPAARHFLNLKKMKLKTLFDLDTNLADKMVILKEVIKHIKSGEMVEGAKYWAIKFFNITEEDLK